MASNPPGTKANRWNQAVNRLSAELGVSTQEADTWLNGVWSRMYQDEVNGNMAAHQRLRAFLEANTTGAPTLPAAFASWVS